MNRYIHKLNQRPLIVLPPDHQSWILLLRSGSIKSIFELYCDFITVTIGVGGCDDCPATDVGHDGAEIVDVEIFGLLLQQELFYLFDVGFQAAVVELL